jgi:multidrug efflux system outer membrane protein
MGAAAVGPAWWRALGSDELDALMTRAEAQNLDLAAAIARVEQADAQVRISGASLLPNLGGSAQVERSSESEPIAQTRTTYTAGATASYEVDFWGANHANVNAARENAIAAAFDHEVVRLTTESSVAQTFLQAVGLTQRIAVAERNLAIGQALLTGLRKRFAVGIGTSLDLTQQETLVATLAAAIPPLQQQRSQSLDSLAILVGEQPEQLSVTTRSFDLMASPIVAPGLPSALLQRRPDVRESEAKLIASNYDIGNARTQFFPMINLTGQGGLSSNSLVKLFTSPTFVYDLASSLTQPIFEGGRLRGQLDLSRARFREQLADYRKSVISAFGDVEDNLAAVARTQQALQQNQVALERARTALQMVQTQFRYGTVDITQQLQTEQTLFRQEDVLVQSRLAQLEAFVGLAKALGGGWSSGDALPTPDEYHAQLTGRPS